MDKLIKEFIEYLTHARAYSEYTETNYEIDLYNYKEFLDKYGYDYKHINYAIISNYTKSLKENNMKSSSINRHLSAVRSFYNYLVRKGVVKSNPFKLVTGPKTESKLPNYMKYNEFEELLNTCDSSPLGIRNRALLELLLATGARVGELIKLDVADVDFSSHEIKVLGKGNKERICYFGEHCAKALEDYLEQSRPILLKNKKSSRLFINHIGGELTDRGVRTIIESLIKKCSLKTKITPHTFRHTFATLLLNEGCDLKSVQELLGHANLNTTSIYTHLTNDRIKDIYLHAHPRGRK